MLRVPEEQTTERWQVPELVVVGVRSAAEVPVEGQPVAVEKPADLVATVAAVYPEAVPAAEVDPAAFAVPTDPAEQVAAVRPQVQAVAAVRPVDLAIPIGLVEQAAGLVEVQSAAVEQREPAETESTERVANSCRSVESRLCSSGDCSCCRRFLENNHRYDLGHRHRRNQHRQQQKSSRRQQ